MTKNTIESRDEKKQNQCNERHLHVSPPSSIREMLHDQASFWNCNYMKLCIFGEEPTIINVKKSVKVLIIAIQLPLSN